MTEGNIHLLVGKYIFTNLNHPVSGGGERERGCSSSLGEIRYINIYVCMFINILIDVVYESCKQ